jgi:hypothetical protein
MLRFTLILPVFISLLLVLSVLTATGVSPSVTVAVDLYHVRYYSGLDILIESCPGCRWVLIVNPYDPLQWDLGERYKRMGYNVEIRHGGFEDGVLDGVDILIIGVVHGDGARGFGEGELENIAKWWASGGGKAFWVASVGDYIVEYPKINRLGSACIISNNPPARAWGSTSQFEVNRLLEILGSRIRVDWASISSPQSPVEGIIVGGALGLKGGKVILPMAAPLYVVQDNTSLNPLHTSLEGVSVVVYSESTISDHDNQSPVFYRVEAREAYPVMVVERRDNRMFVVSGDTMIGGFLDAEILTRIGTCYIRPLQAGLYNSYWEWLTQTGELRRESFNGPELVKATIADAIRFVAGDQAEKLLPGKPKTEAPTGYTTVHAEYNREGERRVWLRISWLSIAAFILAFVIVLFLLRLLRRA